MSARARNKARRDARAAEKRKWELSQRAHAEAIQAETKAAAGKVKEDIQRGKKARIEVTDAKPCNNAAAVSHGEPSSALMLDPVAASLSASADPSSASLLLADGSHPLSPYVRQLCWDLVDEEWIRRHGAAIGLRSILTHHADTIGRNMRATRQHQPHSIASHQAMLADCAARILCVLMLDRFADYAEERVICPVRETAAQVLAIIAVQLDDTNLKLLVNNLVEIAVRSRKTEPGHAYQICTSPFLPVNH